MLPTPIGPAVETLIRIDARAADKEDAIRQAGQLLVAAGCVVPGYEDSMIRREQVANTYLGSGVAIPHGTGEDKGLVRGDGIVVLQFVDGIEWNPGQVAHLVVGIAAGSDSHIAILRRLTRLIQNETRLRELIATRDPEVIAAALRDEAPAPAASGAAEDYPERIEWIVDYPAGLHARPASTWSETAKSAGSPLRVRHGGEAADPRSLVALLQLGLKAGDTIVISAAGANARAALERFHGVVTRLTAQEKAAPASPPGNGAAASTAGPPESERPAGA
ncbi:MAG: HPr family phosphocarrier protein, partial [Gluconacetobacter sp.]